MAKFTKGLASKVLADGRLFRSYNHVTETLTLSVKVDPENDNFNYVDVELTLDELLDSWNFASKANSDAKASPNWLVSK